MDSPYAASGLAARHERKSHRMTGSNPYQPPQRQNGTPNSATTGQRHRKVYGLGGWLILVAIGVILSPIKLGALLFQVHLPLFQDGTWDLLTVPGSEHYHPLWAPLLIFEIVCNLGFIAAYIVQAVLFFRKSRSFPKIYIVVALLNLGFIVLDAWFCSFLLPDQPMLDPDTATEIARSLLGAAIWIPYMLVSERVSNTFVE